MVSVVIPTYNHAHYLGRALQSVIDQTYANWEAIVIDNHSTDSTNEVLESFKDLRIKVLKIHNKGSIAISRNWGMRESGGKWIAFLDSDDCWHPEKLETIMLAVREDDNHDVLCNHELMVNIKTGLNSVLRYGPYKSDFYQVLLVEGNRLSTSATIIRQSFLQQHKLFFNESADYITVEDYGLWLDLARTGARFKFFDKVLGEYLVHESNSSGKLSRHLQNCERLLHDHVYNIQEFNPSPDDLWAKIETRLSMSKLKQALFNLKFVSALNISLRLLMRHPVLTILLIITKLKDTTIQSLKVFSKRKL